MVIVTGGRDSVYVEEEKRYEKQKDKRTRHFDLYSVGENG